MIQIGQDFQLKKNEMQIDVKSIEFFLIMWKQEVVQLMEKKKKLR
jgi:hypothetical protein